jgi:subfamily B ATP-binding cassette protein MsbA
MKYFKRFIKYTFPYKWKGILSIVFNVIYALLSALSFLSLIPMLNVLFGDTKNICEQPVFSGKLSELKVYLETYLNYLITTNTENNGGESTLTYMVIGVVSIFFLKKLVWLFCRSLYGIP